MRAVRFILAVVVFLFFAVYLLTLETGHKVEISDLVRLLSQNQQSDAASPKPSPIEAMRISAN